MKIWYLINKNTIEYAVVFAENEEKALKKLFTYGDVRTDDKDVNAWQVEEFTKEKYNGVLYFY